MQVYRGEVKTPGGKLVAVEFQIAAARLTNVTITGDFFLYPEEALPLLGASLEGAPLASGEDEVRRRLSGVLESKRDEVSLVGTSPDAIATAVTRALAKNHDAAPVLRRGS
jgi:lipoate-protein ligase A